MSEKNKIQTCALFGNLWAIGLVILLFTTTTAFANSEELAVMRKELDQLRKQVQELGNEVKRLKKTAYLLCEIRSPE